MRLAGGRSHQPADGAHHDDAPARRHRPWHRRGGLAVESPVGGKTGTTSDYTDAWFLGFSPSITCGVWVGYDSRESLGEKETGAKAALPIWMTVMKQAIAGKDNEEFLGDPGTEKKPILKAQAEAPAKPVPPPAPRHHPCPSLSSAVLSPGSDQVGRPQGPQ